MYAMYIINVGLGVWKNQKQWWFDNTALFKNISPISFFKQLLRGSIYFFVCLKHCAVFCNYDWIYFQRL